jgi:hypothetical protein
MFHMTGLPGWMRFGAAPAWGAPVAAPTPEQEADYLRAEAEQLRTELDAISTRLNELEGKE